MLKVRIIPCLDVKDGRVVKGVNFVNLRDAGDPVEQAMLYDAAGADELCFLDIAASHEKRGILLDVVRRTAEVCFMPLTVGGGVRTLDDIRSLLLAGADKVGVNTEAVRRPEFIREAAEKFGSQCIVAAIDAKQTAPGKFEVFTHGGRRAHRHRCDRTREKTGQLRRGRNPADFDGSRWNEDGLRSGADARGVRCRHRAGDRQRRRRQPHPSGRGHPRWSRKRGAGGIDFPFRRSDDCTSQGRSLRSRSARTPLILPSLKGRVKGFGQGDNIQRLQHLSRKIETNPILRYAYPMTEGNVEILRPAHQRHGSPHRAPHPVKARPVRLMEDMTTEEAFRVTVLECLAQISANIPAVRARQSEGVHQLRIGLRRLHTGLFAFGDPFRNATVKRLRRRTKGLAGIFGPARDLDVFMEDLFAPVAQSVDNNDALAFLKTRAEDARGQAWDDALEKLDEGGLQEFLDEVAATAEAKSRGKGGAPVSETASRTLAESFLRARKRGRRIDHGEDRDFHRLRIALKKLRYNSEFFEGLYKKKEVRAYLGTVEESAGCAGRDARCSGRPPNLAAPHSR